MKVLMFANSEINSYKFIDKYLMTYDTLYCVDGGLRHADAIGVVPDFIIGDFDSIAPELLEKYEKTGVSFVKFPPEKDFTDLELALRMAIDEGAEEIIILGALGGRVDHELANINLLYIALKNNVRARIMSEAQSICLMDGDIDIVGREGDLVTLLPFGGEAVGITTRGLTYPLKNETLGVGESRGVSNVMLGERAHVAVEKGMLVVIYSYLNI